MASISSLLKGAEATRKKIRQQQDAEVAYEWQQSAKTYGDFQAYTSYLSGQAQKTNDPSELLTYQKSTDSARSGYISNDIQRKSIDVLEGRTTNTQKRSDMTRLYYMAADAGNLDLAQSLNLQIDNLDLHIQQEAQAAQALAGKLSALNAKSIDDAVDKLKGYSQELNTLFKEKGTKKFTDEMAQYSQELGVKPGDFFGMHLRIAQEVNNVYDNALASDTSPDNQRKFQKDKNTFNSTNSISLPAANGGELKVSYQDLVDQADAARTGQTIFRTVQTGDGTTFERNKETGFVWGRDENGAYRAIQVYQPTTNYTSTAYKTKVDSSGNTIYLDAKGQEVAIQGKDGNVRGLNGKSVNDAVKRDYKDLLKQNGFNIVSDSDGYIEIANPMGQKINGIGVDIPGTASETIRLYKNPNGQLQIVGDNSQYYNLGFDDKTGQFTGLLKDQPNPITMLSDNFSQDFISKLDMNRLPAGAVGIVDTGLASSQLLRTAEFTRADIANKQQLEQLDRARAEAAQRGAQATQALQPTLNPQAAPNVNIQAPAASVQRLQPVATVPLQAPSTAGLLQGNQPGRPQQSLQVQQPQRTGNIIVR